MNEKTITLTRHALYDLILRYENEVTCAKELPVFLDRVMDGDEETAEIDYDAHGRVGERITTMRNFFDECSFYCRICGKPFYANELIEIRERVNGIVSISHECIPCKREEDYGVHPKGGGDDRKAE